MRYLAAALLGAAIYTALPASALDQPVVVELFTSQSCSSCPPADALLDELSRSRADILPLGLHVTYWDRLGWRDPFSLAAATERQRRYAAQLGTGQIYTPQMVVNGRWQAVGSDRAAVLDAVAAAKAHTAAVPPVPIRVTVRGDGLFVEIGPGRGAATLWLVGFDARHATPVRGGENGGRVLVETNVVRSLSPVAEWRGEALGLPLTQPAGQRAAVLLQAENGRILGAAVLPAR